MSDTNIPASEASLDQSAVPRKRRNRWGDLQETQNEEVHKSEAPTLVLCQPVANEQTLAEDLTKKPRKSRWGTAEPTPASTSFVSGFSSSMLSSSAPIPTVLTEEVIQQTVVLKLQLQQVNQKLLTVAHDALLIEQDPRRSPSPPPRYDSSGKRTNTREVRMRESLSAQRVSIIEQLMKLNPTFQPPIDFIRAKPVRKIYIPKQKDPNYNFIGLIIGPRGNTQKQMEQETGCKISIRGKGSAKEGSKARTQTPDDDDELHVHITGEIEENVNRAASMIDALLKPMDDSVNEHKQKQLRELALINGTLREDEYCPVCGEKGHRQFDCPYRAKAFKAAGVRCAICDQLSHPTRDCPLKQQPVNNEEQLDTEYDSFLAEIGEGTGNGGAATRSGMSSSVTTTTTPTAGTGIGSAGADGNTMYSEFFGSKKASMGGSGGGGSGGGTTMLSPIVDMVNVTKKPVSQTVINVTTVMTGALPPTYLSMNTVTTGTGTSTSTGTNPSITNPMMTMPSVGAGSTATDATAAAAAANAAYYANYYAHTATPAAEGNAWGGVDYTDPNAVAAYYAQYYAYYAAMYPGMDINTIMAMQQQQQQQQQQQYASSYMYPTAATTAYAAPVPPPDTGVNAPPPPPPPSY